MREELLADGALRLSGDSAAFLFLRARPGVLLTVAKGRDTGEFGTAPLTFVEREYKRFGRPVEWFLDGSAVENATHPVFLRWTDWLAAKPAALRQLHVLPAAGPAQLTMAIAQRLASAEQRMTLYNSRERWAAALEKIVPGLVDIPADRFDEPAGSAERRVNADGTVIMTAPQCSFSFHAISPRVVISEFSGDDTGALGTMPFDEMARLMDEAKGSVSWFIDVSSANTVSMTVAEEWTAWLAAHRSKLAHAGFLAPKRAFPLVITIAKFRSETENLVRLYSTPEEFNAAIAARTDRGSSSGA
jgi:hypothetical protein